MEEEKKDFSPHSPHGPSPASAGLSPGAGCLLPNGGEGKKSSSAPHQWFQSRLTGPPREVWGRRDAKALWSATLSAALLGWLVVALSGGNGWACAVGALVAGVGAMLWAWWRPRRARAVPHAWCLGPDGLFVLSRETARLIALEDIHRLLCQEPKTTQRARAAAGLSHWPLLAVELTGGEVLPLPGWMANRQAFQRALSLCTFERRYARYAQELNTAHAVQLGQVWLTPLGVKAPHRQLARWQDMHALSAGPGYVRYRPMSGFTNPILCSAGEVADVDVLFSLALSLCTRLRRLV